MADIMLLNGPNLNLLGAREQAHYGKQSLSEIVRHLQDIAKQSQLTLSHFQHNAEHELVERIHQANAEQVSYIIINPAALTHTSIALRDALLAVKINFIEVHLSNTYQRESFRKRSYLSDIASGVIIGLGAIGYELALRAAIADMKAH